MPTIGRADIDVHYDGGDLPEEARALGEETGETAGEAHAKEFDKKAQDGFDKTSEDLRKKAGKNGEDSGSSYGERFASSLRKSSQKDIDSFAKGIDDLFKNDDGLDKYAEKLHKLDGDADHIAGTFDEVGSGLKVLRERALLSQDAFEKQGATLDTWRGQVDKSRASLDEHKESLKKWLDEIGVGDGPGAQALKDLGDATFQLGDKAERGGASAARGKSGYHDLIETLKDGKDLDLEQVIGEIERIGSNAEKGGAGASTGEPGYRRLIDTLRTSKNVDVGSLVGDLEKLGSNAKSGGADADQGRGGFGRLFDTMSRSGSLAISGLGDKLASLGDGARRGGEDSDKGTPGFTRLFGAVGNLLKSGIEKVGGIGGELVDFGDNAKKGGNSSAEAAPGFGKLASAFSNFDPGDNIGQLLLLIIALAPQLATLASAAGGGLLILAGGVTALGAAGAVGYAGFSTLLGDIKNVPDQILPARKAVDGLKGDFTDLKNSVAVKMFSGLEGELSDLGTHFFPAVSTAASGIATTLHDVLGRMLTDLNSSGFKDTLDGIFKGAEPSITNLGKIASNVFGIIGQLLLDVMPDVAEFTGGVKDATGKFLAFLDSPKGKTAVQDWIKDAKEVLGKLGDAIGEVAGDLAALVTPDSIDQTISTIGSLADAAGSLAKVGDALAPAIPAIASGVSAISAIFATLGKVLDPFLSGLEIGFAGVYTALTNARNVVSSFIGFLEVGFETAGAVLEAALSGHVEKIPGILQAGADKSKAALSTFETSIAAATGNSSAAFDLFDSKTKTSLDNISTNLGTTGKSSTAFKVELGQDAAAGGVSLQTLAKDKSLDQIAAHLGLTGTAASQFKDHAVAAMDQSKQKFAELDTTSQAHLATVSSKLGATGKASDAFKDAIATNADGSKSKIAALANAKDLETLESKLGIAGDASKTRFANQIIAAMQASGGKIDELPPKVQALISKFGNLSAIDATPNVHLTGAQQAISDADAVASRLRQLNASSATVSIITKQVGSGTAHGAVGGMFVGGKLFNERGVTGRAFAGGGITSGSTFLNSNTLVGEAGPEAIVPLSGALSSVDRSVRALSAYARGRVVDPTQNSAAETGKRLNVAAGAIQVISSSTDGRQVASSVLDRLSAVVGG